MRLEPTLGFTHVTLAHETAGAACLPVSQIHIHHQESKNAAGPSHTSTPVALLVSDTI